MQIEVNGTRLWFDVLPPGVGQLEVIDQAGHFIWLDRPDRYWPLITEFVAAATATTPPGQ